MITAHIYNQAAHSVELFAELRERLGAPKGFDNSERMECGLLLLKETARRDVRPAIATYCRYFHHVVDCILVDISGDEDLIQRVPVRHEQLRVIERGFLETDPLIGERLQKSNQIRLLSRAQVEDPKGQDAALVDIEVARTAVIEIDHLLQRRHAAVMHVRRSQFNVAQRRYFECTARPP